MHGNLNTDTLARSPLVREIKGVIIASHILQMLVQQLCFTISSGFSINATDSFLECVKPFWLQHTGSKHSLDFLRLNDGVLKAILCITLGVFVSVR